MKAAHNFKASVTIQTRSLTFGKMLLATMKSNKQQLKILLWLILNSFHLPKVLSTKWLVENPGFDNPEAWSSGYLPCALEDVVFPYAYPAVMPLPMEVEIKGMILPHEGAILLNADATIELGGAGSKKRDCENGKKRQAYLSQPQVRKWYDPNSWQVISRISNNKAVPVVEQMPCNNETIVIQANGPIAIDMQNVEYMRLGQLSLAGSIISKEYLQQLVNTELGDILFKNTMGLNIEYYRRDVCGCQREYYKFVEPICRNVALSCERPHCLLPITPQGSCCSVCGAALTYKVDKCSDLLYNSLRNAVDKTVKQQNLQNDLDYYVSYHDMSEMGGIILQLLVVDRKAYNERSVNFIEQFKMNIATAKDDLKQLKLLDHVFAGRPYNPNITFASFLMIVLCLAFVAFVGLVIFAHYAPDNRYVRRMPPWTYDPRRWQAMWQRSNFVFARFDNATASGGGGDGRGRVEILGSVGNVQESIIMGYDAESGEVRERAFDNPMFGEIPTAQQSESAPDQKTSNVKSSVAKVENTNLIDDMDDDEQELTEIKLDTDTSDTDDDELVETV